MRQSLVLSIVMVLVVGSAALATIPDPARSGCELRGQVLPCQYRFRADGGLDRLTIKVTLRDSFNVPFPDCSTSATMSLVEGDYCNCCPDRQTGTTGPDGTVEFVWSRIGGYGELQVAVTAHFVGDIPICAPTAKYTSSVLNAICNAENSTNIFSLGVWAGCLPPAPYCERSDYNCDGTVNVIDLGIWAGGLTVGCLVPNSMCPF